MRKAAWKTPRVLSTIPPPALPGSGLRGLPAFRDSQPFGSPCGWHWYRYSTSKAAPGSREGAARRQIVRLWAFGATGARRDPPPGPLWSREGRDSVIPKLHKRPEVFSKPADDFSHRTSGPGSPSPLGLDETAKKPTLFISTSSSPEPPFHRGGFLFVVIRDP